MAPNEHEPSGKRDDDTSETQPTPADVLRSIESNKSPRPDLETPYEVPVTDIERLLADCWGEVLGIWPVGRNDNLLELGGDSIQMAMIAARLKDKLGVELSFDDFFAQPVLAELARVLQARAS